MKPKTISTLFLIAGLFNILGVLIFSKVFTNEVLMNTQPDVMGYFGLLSIILWGLAYIAVHKTYASVPWLVGVFFLEKALYVTVYLRWMNDHSILEIYDQDVLAGIFYSIYGVNDLLTGLFFGFVFFKILKRP